MVPCLVKSTGSASFVAPLALRRALLIVLGMAVIGQMSPFQPDEPHTHTTAPECLSQAQGCTHHIGDMSDPIP